MHGKLRVGNVIAATLLATILGLVSTVALANEPQQRSSFETTMDQYPAIARHVQIIVASAGSQAVCGIQCVSRSTACVSRCNSQYLQAVRSRSYFDNASCQQECTDRFNQCNEQCTDKNSGSSSDDDD